MEPEEPESPHGCEALARERSQPILWVVTRREGEEGGICRAALKDLVNIIEEPVVRLWNKKSLVWRDTSVKALSRHVQITNNRCVAKINQGWQQ